jgi:DNA invertase Pin-like site-specific DNA recombinase
MYRKNPVIPENRNQIRSLLCGGFIFSLKARKARTAEATKYLKKPKAKAEKNSKVILVKT